MATLFSRKTSAKKCLVSVNSSLPSGLRVLQGNRIVSILTTCSRSRSLGHLELFHEGQHSSDEVSRIPVLISTLVMVLIKLRAEMLAETSQDRLVERIQLNRWKVEGLWRLAPAVDILADLLLSECFNGGEFLLSA